MNAGRGVVLGSLLSVALAGSVVSACEEDTVASGPQSSLAPTASVPSTPSGGPPNGTDGGGVPDGGSDGDGGGVTLPSGSTLKFANLSPAAANLCVKLKSDGAFTTPLYPSLVPAGSVSARVDLAPGSYDVKMIVDTSDCSMTGHQTSLNQGGNVGIFYRGLTPPNGPISGGFYESLKTTAGKETIVVHNGTEVNGEPFFHRDDDAGAPVDLFVGYDKAVLVDGDVIGKIVAGTALRALKTKSGGALGLWFDGANVTLCDDLAPTINGLTDCTSAVRAP